MLQNTVIVQTGHLEEHQNQKGDPYVVSVPQNTFNYFNISVIICFCVKTESRLKLWIVNPMIEHIKVYLSFGKHNCICKKVQ